ncbi:hypothetical protein HY357_04855 [Candidatus Roizmanbacteria bacterium]|nr:hypothetical protein [Candidatus Roizmanbacteria bacterium]
MKTLEDRIIDKVYAKETFDVCTRSFLKLILLILTGISGILLSSLLLETLIEQKTLDMFQILFEDVEIMKAYLIDVAYVFFEELPKLELLVLLISFSVFFTLTVTAFSHLHRYMNKIKSILKFWFPQRA